MVGGGMPGRQSGVSGETCRLRARRAGVRALIVPQRPRPQEARLAKPGLGKGGRKVDAGGPQRGKSSAGSAGTAKRGADARTQPKHWSWAEASVWTERMVSALGNGVKGGKWPIPDGPTPSSRMPGCSPFIRPGKPRDIPDEETTDWRAVCGKTARAVRRAGRATALPDPYQAGWRRNGVRREGGRVRVVWGPWNWQW